ncbi:MAG: aminotransferase class V-fold PLP-dependent enzyme [Rhodothermia bacterium]|nr:MAG: aminotransferase class V-fold PLP-dependent enzyme [Rhodothermia bacterium]
MIDALVDRSQYPTLTDSIYLNQASLGLIGQPAVRAMHEFLDDIARHGNQKMTDEDEVGFFEALRACGARILNCETDRLAILASASELHGQLPFLIPPKSDGKIIAVSTDFPAVTRPWIRYEAENDCALCYVDDIATENLTDALIDAIDEQASVVAVSSVQFSTGSLVNIPRLRDATARVDARLVVDVTQAAGLLKIDSENWEADAVVTSGYKWLGGHGGVALAAVSSKLLDRSPLLPGWMGTPEPFNFDAKQLLFAESAHRFTQSTMSYISMVGLTASMERLVSLGESQLESHSRSLALRLIDGARPHGWVPFRELEDPSASPHIVAIAHPTLGVDAAMEALRERHIVCGVRNGRLRFSLAPFNSSDDIDAVVDVLASV